MTVLVRTEIIEALFRTVTTTRGLVMQTVYEAVGHYLAGAVTISVHEHVNVPLYRAIGAVLHG